MTLLDESERFVPKACVDLLTAIGCSTLARANGDLKPVLARPDAYAAGVIEFTGAAMNGKLVLLSSFDFFAASRPGGRDHAMRRDSAADWILVRDWSMELANQLLGRVKNRLCTIGLTLDSKPPKAVSGHSLLVTIRERARPRYTFAVRGQDVVVWFDATLTEGAMRGPFVEPLPEGYVLYF